MKKILIVLSCFIVVFSVAVMNTGCSKLFPASPTSTASPTPTMTADITADIIAGVLTNVNVLGVATVSYQVGVYSAAGVTVTTASVTVTGPAGQKNLVYNGSSGYYEYGSANTADFQYGNKYTITVTDGPKTFAQDVTVPSDISIPGDGSIVTWTNASPGASVNTIVVTTPGPGLHNYGPPLTSPYNLDGAGAFAAGTGIYTVSAVLITTQVTAFGGSNPLSTVSVADTKTAAVVKL